MVGSLVDYFSVCVHIYVFLSIFTFGEILMALNFMYLIIQLLLHSFSICIILDVLPHIIPLLVVFLPIASMVNFL